MAVSSMRKTVGFFWLLIAFASCQHKQVPSAGSFPLNNTKWSLQSISSFSGTFTGLSQPVTLEFRDGRISGFGGCNRYFGSYSNNQQQLHFSGIGITRMACPNGMDIEKSLISSLENTDNYQADNQALILLRGTDITARFEIFK